LAGIAPVVSEIKREYDAYNNDSESSCVISLEDGMGFSPFESEDEQGGAMSHANDREHKEDEDESGASHRYDT
jgi:hypothetical protein